MKEKRPSLRKVRMKTRSTGLQITHLVSRLNTLLQQLHLILSLREAVTRTTIANKIQMLRKTLEFSGSLTESYSMSILYLLKS